MADVQLRILPFDIMARPRVQDPSSVPVLKIPLPNSSSPEEDRRCHRWRPRPTPTIQALARVLITTASAHLDLQLQVIRFLSLPELDCVFQVQGNRNSCCLPGKLLTTSARSPNAGAGHQNSFRPERSIGPPDREVEDVAAW